MRYVHVPTMTERSLAWFTKEFKFGKTPLAEPVLPGVMSHCSMGIITEYPVPAGHKTTGNLVLSNGEIIDETAPMTADELAVASRRVVSMRQARLALNAGGHLAAVEAALDAMTEPDKTNARIEWEYSSTVESDSQWVQQLGTALGLDIETLFDAAEGM